MKTNKLKAAFFRQAVSSICLYLVLLGITDFRANAQTFGSVAMSGGGFVSGVIAAPNDQNVFYARTDVGGAYRWNESTKSWIPLIDWVSADERGLLGIDGIAVDPKVKGRVYMLAGTSYWNDGKTMFLRSDDYGATWDKINVTTQFKAHGNGMGRANGERLAVDPNNSNIIFCGTRYNGLWKSADRGTTWAQVSSLNVTTTPDESGVCVVMFDKNTAVSGITQTIYAGVSRENDNMYVSTDAGATWSLVTGHPTTAQIMPQRFALTSDSRYLYVTYGNGAGPHAMLWSGVTDYYNRGAVYKFDTQLKTWTDVSPVNFMLDLTSVSGDKVHYGAYSGISVDPTNDNRLIATSINSWRGTQYWNIDGTWKDYWGDNIFVSVNGGTTWREMFRYYWVDGGYKPDYTMLDENGSPWIKGNTCHWIGAAVIDPYNPNRAFVTSGNGVFSTDSLFKSYTTTEYVNNVSVTLSHGKSTWQFAAKGLEETVPLDMISIPSGPVVSVIGDYDGFIQTDITTPSTTGRMMTTINGQKCALGSTNGVAFAALKTTVLAKTAGNTATVNNQNVTICGVTLSTDMGATWNQIYADATAVNQIPVKGKLHQGKVAISADGAVVLWAPFSYQISAGSTDTVSVAHKELFYYTNSAWKKCVGVEFSGAPVADQLDANYFYIYNKDDGYVYVSSDKGATFTKKGLAGLSDFKRVQTTPGKKGEVWVPLARTVSSVKSGGLSHSTDGGITFSLIPNITYCEAVSLGKEAPGKTYPTIFIYGTIGSVTGVFMSIDEGASWTRVNDDQHQYGGLANGEFIVADANTYGLVYMSTAGRGIAYMKSSGTTVAVTSVSVTPTTASVGIGSTTQLTATVLPTTASNKTVIWTSSNVAIATVSAAGLVTGVAAGSATITATTQDGSKTASSVVTVTTIPVSSVTVAATASVAASSTTQLTATIAPANATNQAVTWTSSNTAIATVSTTGLVTGVAKGSAIITVTTVSGAKTASCTVTVTSAAIPVTGVSLNKTTASLKKDSTIQLTATVTPDSATDKTVMWASSNTSVATVSATGLVTSIAAGSATITVTTVNSAKTATCVVTVTAPTVLVTGVSLNVSAANISIGATTSLTASVLPTTATNKNVTWTTSNATIATVSSAGVVTGVAAGSAIVTVTTVDGAKTATCTVTVTAASACTFGAPLATSLPSISNKSYTKIYVLGTGGPSLSNVTNLTINWNLANNGLYQLSMATSNGSPSWYNDLRSVATYAFNQAQPEITFASSGFAGLDGAYWVTMDGTNLVLVSKTGGYTIYFSNTATAPVCLKSAKLLSEVSGETVSLYPNPVHDGRITIKLSIEKASTVSVIAYNQVGKVVLKNNFGKYEAGTHAIQLNTNLATGTYFFEVKADDFVKVIKVEVL